MAYCRDGLLRTIRLTRTGARSFFNPLAHSANLANSANGSGPADPPAAASGTPFEVTAEWQPYPAAAVLPNGVEVQVNLTTGRTEARWASRDHSHNSQDSQNRGRVEGEDAPAGAEEYLAQREEEGAPFGCPTR